MNVAVAWACVCWSATNPTGNPSAPPDDYQLDVKSVFPIDPCISVFESTSTGFGLQRLFVTGTMPGDLPIMGNVGTAIWAGWPAHSIFGTRTFSGELRGAVEIWWKTPNQRPLSMPRYLPTRPRWPGFAINTDFYASIFWLICGAPFALRRRLRARRGQCQQCGYPIGVSPVCTECGAALPASAATRLASRHG